MSLMHQLRPGRDSIGVTMNVTRKPEPVTTGVTNPKPVTESVTEPAGLLRRVAILEDKVAALTAQINSGGRSGAERQRAYRERKKAKP